MCILFCVILIVILQWHAISPHRKATMVSTICTLPATAKCTPDGDNLKPPNSTQSIKLCCYGQTFPFPRQMYSLLAIYFQGNEAATYLIMARNWVTMPSPLSHTYPVITFRELFSVLCKHFIPSRGNIPVQSPRSSDQEAITCIHLLRTLVVTFWGKCIPPWSLLGGLHTQWSLFGGLHTLLGGIAIPDLGLDDRMHIHSRSPLRGLHTLLGLLGTAILLGGLHTQVRTAYPSHYPSHLWKLGGRRGQDMRT